MDGSVVRFDTIANLRWNQANLGFAQNIRLGAVPLGVAPTSHKAFLSPREFHRWAKETNWRNVLIIDCRL